MDTKPKKKEKMENRKMEKQEPENSGKLQVGKLKKGTDSCSTPQNTSESFFLNKIDRKNFKKLRPAHKFISYSTHVFWSTFLIGTTTPVLFSPVIQLCECCIIQPISMLRLKTEKKNLSARI